MSTASHPLGIIQADQLYAAAEFKRRLGWSDHAWRSAKRAGLPIKKIGKRVYVSGRQAIEWFETRNG